MTLEYPDGATPLDPDEMDGLNFPYISTRGELNQLEQANIQEGLLWLKRTKRNDLLTESFACELHRKLFGQVWRWAGYFRKTEKNIGIDPIYIGIELRKLLDDLSFWIDNETFEPKEAAIRFHHRLVAIHLFPNGNGRHARIYADVILQKIFKSKPINWSANHDLNQMNERRKMYLQALRNADQGNMEFLLSFAQIEPKP